MFTSEARVHLHMNGIRYFFYFAFIDNLKSILERGILPKNVVRRLQLKHRSFAEESVQARRQGREIQTSTGRHCSVHDMIPVYMNSQTPTLYARRKWQSEFVIFRIPIERALLSDTEFAFCDGNAGDHDSGVYCHPSDLAKLDFEIIRARSWSGYPDGRRKRNAEFLLASIPLEAVDALIVDREASGERVRDVTARSGFHIRVIVDRAYFF